MAPGAPTTLGELLVLMETEGDAAYGEHVTVMAHALQCAALARAEGAPDELVAAALLHDVGHLVAGVQGSGRFRLDHDDDEHERVGGRVLGPIFGPAVAQPVALHVLAKRWRCAADPAYRHALSDASRATLVAQGGPLDEAGQRRFESHPGFAAARRVRDWDDAGKVVGQAVPALDTYETVLQGLARRAAAAR